jgi:hypothetical protein
LFKLQLISSFNLADSLSHFETDCVLLLRFNECLDFIMISSYHSTKQGAPPLGVKRSGHEADHSPPPSAEVNAWSYTSAPRYAFKAWCLVKAQGQLLPLQYK